MVDKIIFVLVWWVRNGVDFVYSFFLIYVENEWLKEKIDSYDDVV